MPNIQNMYQLILEMNKLKLVFRNTTTNPDRKESTAEHSWSASMITIILMNELKKEFSEINELKTVKLTLIHDVVEIYAGDVMAFDTEARKNKEKIEAEALKKLMIVYPEFGQQLHDLWREFEEKKSVESKIAKAADAICPIFQRLQSKQSYIPFNLTIANLEKTKYPHFIFSKTFTTLYQKLKTDLLEEKLINNDDD
ncbi:MAG: hydrolase [Gammaproteobacteria bacterium RIFCSPHIGHO2_12_FULL_37_34]|nr:MAG: hydrolase [Gammaproteobacteria bacterium RIFCSPHIGHO2_12_FULL_37_34]